MGLFNFLKPKKDPMVEMAEKLSNSIFPKGAKDIDAGAKEVLRILNNSLDYETARTIFTRSAGISRIASTFDKERLTSHLSGYCIQHFNEGQIEKLYAYLSALTAAMVIHQRTPSEVRREGDDYVW